ncbi:MAG TPA: type II toxin-antitoxin system VapC family toxin [Bryobacteraceae bacterium]|nr:type II toxin-antitoxin system VapC family toxin [Bryobacteraceae bacterium]
MALYYLETSAAVKLYIREPGTAQLLRLTKSRSDRFAVLSITQVEFRSAVRRRQRAGDLSQDLAATLVKRFARHLESFFLRQTLSDGVLEVSCDLLDRHPLRAYDAVQLAGCLVLKASNSKEYTVFVCSNEPLIRAAQMEGVEVLDPSAAA